MFRTIYWPVPQQLAQEDKSSLAIVDSKSIDNANTVLEKGYDTGKNVPRVKVHIAVDTLGLPHEILITCANEADRNGVMERLKSFLEP